MRRWLMGCGMAALVLAGAVTGGWLYVKAKVPLPEGVRVEPQQLVNLVRQEPVRPMNLLVLGVDADETRTDVILLARWDPPNRRLNLLSLPRDTLVEIPCPAAVRSCLSPDKLGHAHAYGTVIGQGPALARATVEQFLGTKVDYFVRLNFAGFARVVDALGGLRLQVESDMPEIGLAAGEHHLNGEQALAYVRYRSDGQGDIGRIQRTHRFLRALAEQAGRGTVDQPALLKEALPHVTTDLDVGTLLALGRDWRAMQPDLAVNFTFLPGAAGEYRGLWVWRVDEAAKGTILRESGFGH